MALDENKADLALLLLSHFIEHSWQVEPVIVTAGGFVEATAVKSRMETMVVSARDTDVLLLLLTHYDKMGCTHLYMKAGTSKEPKYFSGHGIRREVLSTDQINALLAFHAVTGWDNISQFGGHGTKTAWQVFQKHHMDLNDLGKGHLTENTVVSAGKFICKMYGIPEVDTCSKTRVKLSCLGRAQDNLPPTSDAAKFHIMHSHYQVSGTRPTYSTLIFPQKKWDGCTRKVN